MSRPIDMSAISPVIGPDALRDGIHIWYYPLDRGRVETEAYAGLLDAAERARAERFRFVVHRRRFVVGRGTLRRILGHYAGCDPRQLRFAHGDHGKPYLAGPDGVDCLRFSVSNSGGVGAVAVARSGELGLDIEALRPNVDHELIAQREFAAEEKAWLFAQPDTRRLAAFYELWTCKEAYLKGKGVGLHAALNRFSMSLDGPGAPRLLWSELNIADAQRWTFDRVTTLPGYLACLAAEGYRCDADDRALSARPWPGGSAAAGAAFAG